MHMRVHICKKNIKRRCSFYSKSTCMSHVGRVEPHLSSAYRFRVSSPLSPSSLFSFPHSLPPSFFFYLSFLSCLHFISSRVIVLVARNFQSFTHCRRALVVALVYVRRRDRVGWQVRWLSATVITEACFIFLILSTPPFSCTVAGVGHHHHHLGTVNYRRVKDQQV